MRENKHTSNSNYPKEMSQDQARAILLCVEHGKPAQLRLYIEALTVCLNSGCDSVAEFIAAHDPIPVIASP